MNKILSPGDVYKTPGIGYMRILMADSIYLQYEAMDYTGWNKSNKLNAHLSFYGLSVNYFWAVEPEYLSNESYTEEEINIIRPDLPLSLGRSKKYNWRDLTSITSDNFNSYFSPRTILSLDCKKIFVYPKGPKGGRLKQVAITPDNSRSIEFWELISKIALIQNTANADLVGGTGLFRLGSFQKYPTFVIDDYYFGDVGAYKQKEEGFDWVSYLAEQKNRKPFFSYEKVNEDGEYRVNFDPNQVTLGSDVFAVQSNFKGKIVIQFTVEKAQHTFNLNGLQPATYYLGFLNKDGRFSTHQSMIYGY